MTRRKPVELMNIENNDSGKAGRAPSKRARPSRRARKPSGHSLYERFYTLNELQALLESAGLDSLEAEVGAARVAIMRVLEQEEDPVKLATTVSKVVHEIVSAAKVNHLLSGDAAQGLLEATNKILEDMGLGDRG